MTRVMCVALLVAVCALRQTFAATPAFVDITWMSISNMYYEIGPNSASAVDLHVPIVVDGVDHGAPIENLKAAMTDAKLTSVDLWIGSSTAPVAKLVVPLLRPKAFLPVHWDGLWGAFEAGVPKPYGDSGVETVLKASGVSVVTPAQYMDKWRLDRNGVRPVANTEVKKALGFN